MYFFLMTFQISVLLIQLSCQHVLSIYDDIYCRILATYIKVRIDELLMDLHDVTFLPSQDSFPTTFLSNCGRGESLGATTCLCGKQGHAPCKILLLQQSLFVSVEFH